MKITTFILTFAAAICSLTSCENKMNTPLQMNATQLANINNEPFYVASKDTTMIEISSQNDDDVSYEDIALNLVERYYDMMPQFKLRFPSYIDPDDTVTFKLEIPDSEGKTEDVTFGHISGNGLEFNSLDDLMNYRKTVYSEKYASETFDYEVVDISDKYSDGDFINDADVKSHKGLYHSSYVTYKGKLYVNRRHFYGGWIGHMKPNEPIIITDITYTSFRAYYPCIYGRDEVVSYLGCDVVDFIIDPCCGEWRINNLESKSYSLYMNISENLSLAGTMIDTEDLSADDYKEAREVQIEEMEQYKNDTTEEKTFTKGASNSNTYTSEYAGIRIVAPEYAEFLDEANLYTEYMMSTRFMYEEEKEYYLTAMKDASVSYGEPYGSIDVWFYNIKERYHETEEMSAESFILREFCNDHGKGDLEKINGPDTVTICGNEYLKIMRSDIINEYSTYVRKIDDTYIIVINAYGCAVDDIESRFEAIG